MLSKYIDWKNGLSFVRCGEVIIMMIDINDNEGTFTPHVYGEKEKAGVAFPVRKDLADNFVCRGTIVLGI